MSPDPTPDGPVYGLTRNLWALWSRFGRGDGCALHRTAGALWFDTPIASLPYNAVLRFAAGHDPDRRLDRLFRHYQQRRVPFLWMVHPGAEPGDLPARLRARGLEEVECCPGMFADLHDLPAPDPAPSGVVVRQVTAARDHRGFLDLVAWRWGVRAEDRPRLDGVTRAFGVGAPGSRVRAWLAWQEDRPVAKAVLHLSAGAAGLYGVATRPEARGLGLARLLTLTAFQAARRAGHRLGVLHSTPMAQRLYQRLGFRVAAPFRIFARPRTFDAL